MEKEVRLCVKCVTTKECFGKCVPLCKECRNEISKHKNIIDEVNGLCHCEEKEVF